MPEPLEGEVLESLCDYLERKRYFFWRTNNTGIKRSFKDKKTGQTREFWTVNKYSKKGIPDITLIKNGAVIFIEAKRPSGVMSSDQIIFRDECIKNNISYIIAKSIDDLIIENL